VPNKCYKGGLVGDQMKKRLEFCKRCNNEEPHRVKRKTFKEKKKLSSYMLPLKCMTCGYVEGKITKQKKKEKHISLS